MFKTLKIILIVLVVIFLGFVGWMNATPGFFQIVCCGTVEYATYKQKSEKFCDNCWTEVSANQKMINMALVDLAKIDFNKGKAPMPGSLLPL